jgi:hypothetical protein
MRKLPILATVKHVLNSIIAYRNAGLRIGLPWILILVALSLVGEFLIGEPAAPASGRVGFYAVVQFAVNLLALGSIAVNWNRFVLRDELPAAQNALRLDGPVWRYTANSVLIGLITFLPVAVLTAILTALMPPATILALPAVAVAGTANFMLSVKLPAIALGRTDFGLADAMKACEGNFWQIMGVVLLGTLIAFALILAVIILAALLSYLPQAIGIIIELPVNAAVSLFLILFGVNLLTSLYGFFVERRDF